MQHRLHFQLLAGLQVAVMVGPSLILYSLGALIWFPFFVFIPIGQFLLLAITESPAAAIQKAELFANSSFLAVTAFMIGAGIGLLALLCLYAAACSGRSLREIRSWIWCGLLAGIAAASVVTKPQVLLISFAFPATLAGASVFVLLLFGFGPLVSLLIAMLWLFQNGRIQQRANRTARF